MPVNDPMELFGRWLHDAHTSESKDWNAMCLSTVGPDGRPSARMVLLKDHDELGFVFYTNLTSRKARHLEARPFAALTFFWSRLDRQVRVEGAVEQVPDTEADAYFATRPRGSQLGAWASRQSEALDARETLVTRVEEVERRFEGADVPRPPNWSGFRLVPERVEFWTGVRIASTSGCSSAAPRSATGPGSCSTPDGRHSLLRPCFRAPALRSAARRTEPRTEGLAAPGRALE